MSPCAQAHAFLLVHHGGAPTLAERASGQPEWDPATDPEMPQGRCNIGLYRPQLYGRCSVARVHLQTSSPLDLVRHLPLRSYTHVNAGGAYVLAADRGAFGAPRAGLGFRDTRLPCCPVDGAPPKESAAWRRSLAPTGKSARASERHTPARDASR